MDKIDFKNNQEPDLSAETLNQMQTNIENAINDKNIISVGLSANVTLTATGEQKIKLDKILCQLGNKFSLKDGKIYVGKGIEKVLVSGSVCFNFADLRETMAYNINIYQNTAEVITALNSSEIKSLNGTNRTLEVSPTLLNVKEGDYFQFNCYASKNDTISSYTNRTKITIQAVN